MFHMVRFWAGARSWSKSRWQSWRSIIRIVPQAGQAVTVAAVLNLVIGPLAAFLIAAAALVARFGNRGSLSRWSAAEATLLRDASGRCSTCHSRRSGSSR